MPSVISATTAVAVANSVMSGNLASLPTEVPTTECSAEDAEDRTVRGPMEQDNDGDDDEEEEEVSSDEMCLEAKEVVQYSSSESSSDEDDDFKDDGEDSDYGGGKGEWGLIINLFFK